VREVLRHGIACTDVGLFESYRLVVGYLNKVGLVARDPSQCPLTMELWSAGGRNLA
jgi:hypothetical protein